MALEMIIDAYRGGFSIPAIYMDVFQEALYEIGRLWETERITVADEHMGTVRKEVINMPNKDGTGPKGQGPKDGHGHGKGKGKGNSPGQGSMTGGKQGDKEKTEK